MNQYIITEEQLQGYEKTRNRLYDINGEHYVTGFAVKIQSHPYQSERDKVLDLITTFRKEQSKELKIHDMWVAEAEYLKELRQAGSP